MITIVEFFPESASVSWAAARRVIDGESELLVAFDCNVYCYNDPGGTKGWTQRELSPFAFVKEMRKLKQAGGSVGAYLNELKKLGILSKSNLIGEYPDFSEFHRTTYGEPWVESQAEIKVSQIPIRVWAGRHLVGW
jgi:hypothetical protein